jgi:biopolymer transport protein ExbB
LFSIVQAAGWPIWFLILASVAAVALIVERSLSLKRLKVMPPKLLQEVLTVHRNGQVTGEVIQRLEANSPLGRVLATALRHSHSNRIAAREAVEETGRAVVHDLEKYLSILGTIATVSPLLGLFGTVIGMIEIFGAQAPSGTNPQKLAHGISVALYNTALGIGVAIPALIAYRHFRSKVDGYMIEMEQHAIRVVDTVSGARQ